MQELAETVGITLNFQEDKFSSSDSELEKYYEINVQAAKFFSDNLLKSESGEIARDYLKKRNIKTQTQKLFGIEHDKR